jgi:hypothetical protein
MKAGLPLTRAVILIYALASAALYSGLMPPWEGFDELYHYGAVQSLATTGEFAVIGKTALSRELWNSLDDLPVSHYIQPYLERPSNSFEEYFRLTAEQRAGLRRGADSMDRAARHQDSPRINYEAKQAPLTYLLLAPIEAMLARTALSTRVLVLRLVLSFVTIPLLWIGARRLAACLDVRGPLEGVFLLVVFSCQMLYAETCRVGNDALAAPWLVWFLLAAIEAFRAPGWKRTVQAAVLMGAGLLMKSTLLIFVPLAFAAPVALFVRRKVKLGGTLKHGALSAGILFVVAGPWYLRNLVKYHNLTATEETSGLSAGELFRTAVGFPWSRSIAEMAHSFLWTGNNSFTTFSYATLNLVLALLAVSLVLYALRARASFAEGITMAAILSYAAVLILTALVFYRSSGGLVAVAMPWYGQVILAPVVGLAFAGLSRWKRVGKWVALATVVVWGYVAAVTWIAKLVPLYGGFEDAHARPAQLWNWYLHSAVQRDSVLSALCPAPLPMLYLLAAIVLGTLAVAAGRVLWALFRQPT